MTMKGFMFKIDFKQKQFDDITYRNKQICIDRDRIFGF